MRIQKRNQIEFGFINHGGRRKNAGRKKRKLDEPPHIARPVLNHRTPFHCGLKLRHGIPSPREPKFFKALARALRIAKSKGLAVTQFAIESNHLHLIGEVESNAELRTGMLSLIASITWIIRKLYRRHGKTFAKRYFLHAIKTPREMRNALRYVIFNHCHHLNSSLFADAYSSAHAFRDVGLFINSVGAPPPWLAEIRSSLSKAESWLQTVGWKVRRPT